MTFDSGYQKRFADYLRNQSAETDVMPSASGNAYQNRFAAYLRGQSTATTKHVSTSTQTARVPERLSTAQNFDIGRTLTSGAVIPKGMRHAADDTAHDLTSGVNHTTLVDLPAAVGNYTNAVKDTAAARGIRQALRDEQSGKSDNTRYGQYLRLMTPEEREKATRLEIDGGLSETKRGAYIRSLNLDERIREKNAAEQQKLVETLEKNIGFAKASKNAAGERYAKWAAGKDVISGRGEAAPVPGEFRVLTQKQKNTFKAYADAGDFEAVTR